MGVLLLAFLLPFVICDTPPEFTDQDFDDKIALKENTLVMFYAPWCGHCKRLKPSFESAWKTLSSHPDVQLALVDCTKQDKTCARYGVSGYPTLKFFKNGAFIHDFDGSRNEDGIVEYVLSRSKTASVELTNEAELKEFLENDEAQFTPLLITYMQSKSDALLNVHMKIASDMFRETLCAHTFDPKILGATGGYLIRLYRPKLLVTPLTEAYVDFAGDPSENTIREWIQRKSQGLVGYRTRKNQGLFPADNILLFYHNASLEKHPKGVNYYRNRLTQIMRETSMEDSPIVFAYTYSDDFYHEINELQHEDEQYPFIVLLSDGKKYILKNYSREALMQFLDSFENGALTPFIKSEPVPTEQTAPLIKAVGKNFDSIVNDPTKDIFIMFHAPWCGHCKQLMPKFASVADKLSAEPGVALVTYDATANEIFPPYQVQSYPTLYFVSKHSKQTPERYEGPREIDDLLKFVAKKSSEELVGYDRDGKPKKEDL